MDKLSVAQAVGHPIADAMPQNACQNYHRTAGTHWLGHLTPICVQSNFNYRHKGHKTPDYFVCTSIHQVKICTCKLNVVHMNVRYFSLKVAYFFEENRLSKNYQNGQFK